ncbi:ABC transporter ATP-binding protein [Legionella oakridgensis]|nr:ABC transporter ATP-binding protein [Legionella oakridgensis]KTD37849.1 ABC dipeptide/oligopeptide/nickel transport, ATPase component [Legionella oakridgensis]STY19698.1 ABC dipeptide/oligopeptide/nickel transport, ATPase component [Legionella longbeachae]
MHTAEVKHLSIAFQTEKQVITAVDDVSFYLNAGETLALLGESGCGKSLTSLAMMRLLPPNGVYGQKSEVVLGEQELLNLPECLMRGIRGRRLAMIFQEPMTALNPVLSIGEQLSEALRRHQTMSRAQIKEHMLALLNEVEMPQPARRLRQYPHQLSGGQKQRVVIAMALASRPEVLIADEPTTALDVTIQAQILKLLKKLQQQRQMSLLMITHDLGVVKTMADQVCVMYAGQVVETANVDDFFKQPLHPYSQQLLVSLPSFAKRGQQLQAIGGVVPVLDAMPAGCRFHPRCAHVFAPCATVEPQLQEPKPTRLVRCHLYPEHDCPPALVQQEQSWTTSHTSNEIILSVEHLAVYFATGGWLKRNRDIHKAVDGLSFNLRKGQTLALVGESGCGKTTTARALLRLQPITSGQIMYHGQNVSDLRGRTLRAFRKKVQIIFQDPFSSMNPRMTVGEILAEGMLAQGMRHAQIHKKQVQLLEQVNLSVKSLHRYPHQFSGGQRQRICIARALATEPELLICDEPTSALDISVQAQILNLLKELQQSFGLSYLFITHNMGVVAYLADEVLVMRAGKAVEQGDCETIFNHPSHSYTRQLLESVPHV